MEDIFTADRYPLYSYLRAGQMNQEDAEDVLQGFFEKMLRTDSLGDADPAHGNLRTFLLAALSRFQSNWQRGERRRHQRVRVESDLWDAEEARWQQEQHATQETPELAFERRWAAELIAQVRARLRADYDKRGKLDLYNTLAPFLSSEGPDTLVATATRLGMNENALRIALTRMRQDFRHLLLQEVKQTLDEGDDARAEIRHLLGVFERR